MRALYSGEVIRVQLSIIVLLLTLVTVTAITRHPSWFSETPAATQHRSNQPSLRSPSHGWWVAGRSVGM